ncbi:unnamed protein product [Trichogramma brassicae]|uniref:Uncharacterized protein n=1 Tax=Trichogramma brassicae TaxID=86971 RepID=A0A6H5J313_9HYME|nr:unnamed protein product [Trichogramma brassicae]
MFPRWPTRCTRYESRPGEELRRRSRDAIPMVSPGGLPGTRYEYDQATTSPRKSRCYGYYVPRVCLLGAPGVNIDPTTRLSPRKSRC